jgi:hypothetical protein
MLMLKWIIFWYLPDIHTRHPWKNRNFMLFEFINKLKLFFFILLLCSCSLYKKMCVLFLSWNLNGNFWKVFFMLVIIFILVFSLTRTLLSKPFFLLFFLYLFDLSIIIFFYLKLMRPCSFHTNSTWLILLRDWKNVVAFSTFFYDKNWWNIQFLIC